MFRSCSPLTCGYIFHIFISHTKILQFSVSFSFTFPLDDTAEHWWWSFSDFRRLSSVAPQLPDPQYTQPVRLAEHRRVHICFPHRLPPPTFSISIMKFFLILKLRLIYYYRYCIPSINGFLHAFHGTNNVFIYCEF